MMSFFFVQYLACQNNETHCSDIKYLSEINNKSYKSFFSETLLYTISNDDGKKIQLDVYDFNRDSNFFYSIVEKKTEFDDILDFCIVQDSILYFLTNNLLHKYNLRTTKFEIFELKKFYNQLYPFGNGVCIFADGVLNLKKNLVELLYFDSGKFNTLDNVPIEIYFQKLNIETNYNFMTAKGNLIVRMDPLTNLMSVYRINNDEVEQYSFKLDFLIDTSIKERLICKANNFAKSNTSANFNSFFEIADSMSKISRIAVIDDTTIALLYRFGKIHESFRKEILFFYRIDFVQNKIRKLKDSIIFQPSITSFNNNISDTSTIVTCSNWLMSLYNGEIHSTNNYLLYLGSLPDNSCFGNSRINCIRLRQNQSIKPFGLAKFRYTYSNK